eukprot:TRINITY_DN3226_c0_g3_i1.p1 TRINITY_DN3226_c0_g3~~TRINITY_DN3226_c0_g3_i1.p1  ORF type:complete len:1131 (-),score=184.04 TRINITY_DN3226_c0_g3_i1:275-3667(-)
MTVVMNCADLSTSTKFKAFDQLGSFKYSQRQVFLLRGNRNTRYARRFCCVRATLDQRIPTRADTDTEAEQTEARKTLQDNLKFLQDHGYAGGSQATSSNGAPLKPGLPLVESSLSQLSSFTPRRSPVDLEKVLEIFPYQVDKFQQDALKSIVFGRNVVVCAPTGAGKTSIAVGAAFRCLLKGQRVIYTTPLKALSNQKFNEFKEIFGEKRVGLQTGDVAYNAHAEVLVMTTEIFRNQLYREDSEAYMGVVQNVASIGLVVLDEVHYLGDKYRGTVWEEVIINCPQHIQMVAMSATVSNPKDLGMWINHVHGRCDTIQTNERPIPLKFWFGYEWTTYQVKKKQKSVSELEDEDEEEDDKKRKKKKSSAVEKQSITSSETKILPLMSNPKKGALNASLLQTSTSLFEDVDHDSPSQLSKMCGPKDPDIIHRLQKQKMLPVIYFLFSRMKCDKRAVELYQQGVELVTKAEYAEIYNEIITLKKENPDAIKEELVNPMCAGIASHHAGLLPAWKALTEQLFQKGLVKVVFATETLAAGINMPAKTTVISALARYRDLELQRLSTNELLQMAGRAGRRGYDTQGNTIIIHGQFSRPKSSVRLINRGSEPLESQFTATYGMVLNLLFSRDLKQSKQFVEKSFMSFMGQKGDGQIKRRIRDIQEEILEMREDIRELEDPSRKKVMEQGRDVATDAAKAYRTKFLDLSKKYRQDRSVVIMDKLKDMQLPQLTTLQIRTKTKANFIPGVIFATITKQQIKARKRPQGQSKNVIDLFLKKDVQDYLVCLGSNNKVHLVPPGGVCALGGQFNMDEEMQQKLYQQVLEINGLAWGELRYDQGYSVDGTASMIPYAYQLQPCENPKEFVDKEMEQQLQQTIANLKVAKKERKQLRTSAKSRSSRGQRISDRPERMSPEVEAIYERIQKRKKFLSILNKKLISLEQSDGSTHWKEFLAVVKVLSKVKALDEKNKPTELGMIARDIRGDNELWYALVLAKPELGKLSPPELAAVLGALLAGSMFSSKTDLKCVYETTGKVLETLDELAILQEKLLQIQEAYRLDRPIAIQPQVCGIVEAWARGQTWEALVEGCDLDEGDLARLLMRIIDFLKQVVYIDQVWEGVRANCKLALMDMDRAPVSEVYV